MVGKLVYATILMALAIFLLIGGVSCDSLVLPLSQNGFNITVTTIGTQPHETTLHLAIEHNPNINATIPHNITIRSNNTNKVITTNPISIRSSNNKFTYQAKLSNMLIPELIEEIKNTYNEKRNKAVQEYNKFVEKKDYELMRQLIKGNLVSYEEMKRLEEKEGQLHDAMNHIKVNYNAICKKYITITIEPTLP